MRYTRQIFDRSFDFGRRARGADFVEAVTLRDLKAFARSCRTAPAIFVQIKTPAVCQTKNTRTNGFGVVWCLGCWRDIKIHVNMVVWFCFGGKLPVLWPTKLTQTSHKSHHKHVFCGLVVFWVFGRDTLKERTDQLGGVPKTRNGKRY